MCCGNDPVVPAPQVATNRMVKMPDGVWTEVSSRAEEQAKRQEVYAKMRDAARTAWRTQKS